MSTSSNIYPVIAGISRMTEKQDWEEISPSRFLSQALELALKDVSSNDVTLVERLKPHISDVITIRFGLDERLNEKTPIKPYKNLAQQIAKQTGIDHVKQRYFATSSGGDTPQKLVNEFSEKIVNGQAECVIILGGEFLDAYSRYLQTKKAMPPWGGSVEEDKVTKPVDATLGHFHPDGLNECERKNELSAPRQMYPVLEQAYRKLANVSIQKQLERNGALFERFSMIAAQSPKLSWFPQARTAKEIYSESPSNRWVGFPYTK
jgi:acetyl-CoA C-acetyltransferase